MLDRQSGGGELSQWLVEGQKIIRAQLAAPQSGTKRRGGRLQVQNAQLQAQEPAVGLGLVVGVNRAGYCLPVRCLGTVCESRQWVRSLSHRGGSSGNSNVLGGLV
jgi:hypothetical protein